MDLKIQQNKGNISRDVMQLLLSADPDRNAVLSYLDSATVLTASIAEGTVGVAAFIVIGADAELKN